MADDELRQARVDLAAICRWAYRLGYQSGVGNHFSLMVPGSDDRFLVTPEGFYWSEVTASDLVVCDLDGKVIDSNHSIETTAFSLHAPIHRVNKAAQCVLHTHMPNATALCLIKGARIEPVHQSSLAYVGRVAYDESYSGVALSYEEGLRVAGVLGDNHTILLRNHGPLVVGPTVAEAFVRLNFLEELCGWQLNAMQTGRELQQIDPAVVERGRRNAEAGGLAAYAKTQLAAMKRVLDRQEPDFRH